MDRAVTVRIGRRSVRTVPAGPESLFRGAQPRFVIPAEAGIHFAGYFAARGLWIPAPFGYRSGQAPQE